MGDIGLAQMVRNAESMYSTVTPVFTTLGVTGGVTSCWVCVGTRSKSRLPPPAFALKKTFIDAAYSDAAAGAVQVMFTAAPVAAAAASELDAVMLVGKTLAVSWAEVKGRASTRCV